MDRGEGHGLLLHTLPKLSLPTNLVRNYIIRFRKVLEGPRIEREPSNSSVDGELGDEECLIGIARIPSF